MAFHKAERPASAVAENRPQEVHHARQRDDSSLSHPTPKAQARRTPMSDWREAYQVHPAADVFPMMSDDELAKLGQDIKALTIPVLFWRNGEDRVLIDGRSRLDAMERVGLDPLEAMTETFTCKDPVTHILSLNIRRRHPTLQQQLDLIVAARMAVNKPGHDGPVSKGGRGKVSPVKAAVIADAKAAGLDPSESTVKRAIAKAEGKVPARPRRRSKAEIAAVRAQGIEAAVELAAKAAGKTPATMPKYTARPTPKPKSGKPVVGINAVRQCYLDRCAEPDIDLDAEQKRIIDALREIAGKRVMPAQSPWTNPTPDIGQLVDDLLLGNIPECLGRRRQP